jgi:hypothetical protein
MTKTTNLSHNARNTGNAGNVIGKPMRARFFTADPGSTLNLILHLVAFGSGSRVHKLTPRSKLADLTNA